MSAIGKLMESLPKRAGRTEADSALITSGRNRRYLTGFHSSAGYVFVTREKAYFLTDFRYFEAAQRVVKDCEVLMYARPAEGLQQIIKKHGLKHVLFENAELTLGDAKNYERILAEAGASAVEDDTLDKLLRDLRVIKTPEEIQKIKAAQRITDAAFTHILRRIRPGVTEREIALEIEFFMRREGADGVAFDLIVVSGENGSLCHGVPSQKKIEKGEFITMDIGAVLDGYHSDMTRTVALGQISPEQKKVYHTVLEAQIAALGQCRPGVACGSVDKAARDIIEKDYPGTFGHSTGHGVGVEIHEWPRFAPGDKTIARPGMVVTVEPGIYLAGRFGVRIEDMVAITETGYENLTHSPKELIQL